MNGITQEKKMTIKEIAYILEVSPEAIRKHVRNMYPDLIAHGKITYLNELQLTEIKRKMKQSTAVDSASTSIEMEQKTLEVLDYWITKAKQSAIDNKQLQEENKKLIPKATFHDTVTQVDGWHDMLEVSKLLGIGRTKLYQLLREHNILRYNNEPYQKYVDRQYFKRVEKLYKDKKENDRISIKTVVSQKGISFISKVLNV